MASLFPSCRDGGGVAGQLGFLGRLQRGEATSQAPGGACYLTLQSPAAGRLVRRIPRGELLPLGEPLPLAELLPSSGDQSLDQGRCKLLGRCELLWLSWGLSVLMGEPCVQLLGILEESPWVP